MLSLKTMHKLGGCKNKENGDLAGLGNARYRKARYE
jgi:hypothetical protein